MDRVRKAVRGTWVYNSMMRLYDPLIGEVSFMKFLNKRMEDLDSCPSCSNCQSTSSSSFSGSSSSGPPSSGTLSRKTISSQSGRALGERLDGTIRVDRGC